jgi:hypothetical protein
MFKLKEQLKQRDLRAFMTQMKRLMPEGELWESATELPIYLYWDLMVRAAYAAGWVEGDPIDIDDLPLPNDVPEWGQIVFERYRQAVAPDPS